MTVEQYLRKNTERADAVEIKKRLPQFSYHKIWRNLNGHVKPDPLIVAEAIKLFAERKEKQKKIIQEFQKLES